MSVSIIIAILFALMPTCPTEDAMNCSWSGGSNGTGSSFVDIGGTAYYLDGVHRD